MADKYLLKVGLDLDQAALSKLTGAISDELTSMGKISDKFVDNALETARKYNEEIQKQESIIKNIEKRLRNTNLDPATRKLLTDTKDKAQGIIDSYRNGDESKGLAPKAVVDAQAEYAKGVMSTSQKFNKFKDKMSAVTGKVAGFAAGIGTAIGVVQSFVNKIGEAIDKISNYSNQLNPLGGFGSTSQRNLMSRYGMTSTQALGFSNTLDAMGLSESDIGRMTESQRAVFNELTSYWNEMMGSLDTEKMQRFNETMEQYQLIQAKFQMGLQGTIMKLLSESPQFEKFMGKIEDLMDATLEFLGSDLVQAVFDGLIGFLTTVVTLLEKAMRLISKIPGFGGGSSVTNNDNSTNTSTFNIYGNDYRSNDELARSISYSNKGGYKG